ncbi:IS6 family transposase [Roseovarius sp.]|uniref:IS6 family transposase n=1 Tax=Roseovarius sp. TaxID=1486281 RepID=UPI0032EAA62B
MSKPNPFRYFRTSRKIIRLAVMMYVRFPLSLRNVEDLLHERGIDVSHESVRFWWMRFGPLFASEIRKARAQRMRCYSNWQWHLDEVFVKINGETHYMWRAVDHEGEVLDAFVTKRRDRKAALKFLRKLMKRYGQPDRIVTDKLRSYGAAMKEIGNADRCQRRSKIRPLWRSKSRPVWGERLGACGPHIASPVQGALAVRPIL